MRGVVVVCALFAPGIAAADCGGADVLFCPVEGSGKVIAVCAGPDGFSYSFGPPGKPEITLFSRYESGPVTPWSGVGRSIWSSVRFLNDGYVYETWMSVDRLAEEQVAEGGVTVLVMPSEEIVAEVNCRAGEVSADLFGPEDAMAQAGFCWDLTAFEWRKGDCS
jgi:hypothetical protein